MLKRYTKKVVLAYDSDGPGQAATERALKIMSSVDLDASVLVINGAKDPDEFINRYGADEFRKLVDDSKAGFEFRISKAMENRDMNDPDEKIKAISEICDFISEVPSKVEREIYVSQVAKRFDVSKESVVADVDRSVRRKKRAEKKKSREAFVNEKRGYGDKANMDFVKFPRLAKLEESVIGIVLFKPEYIDQKIDGTLLSSDDFLSDYCKRIFEFISLKNAEGSFDIGYLNEDFNEAEIARAFKLMTDRQRLDDNSPKVFCDLVREMRSERNGRSEGSSENTVDSILSILNKKSNDN